MGSVIRMAFLYLFLLAALRFAGKRTLSELTTFDFVLLLIISEATQQAILGDDYSMTNAVLTIVTIIFLDILFGRVKQRFKRFEKATEGVPVILIANGEVLRDQLDANHVDLDEIMQEARRSQGLERVDQIKWAVLERGGGVSVIPKE